MKLKIFLLVAIAMFSLSNMRANVYDDNLLQVSLVMASFEHEYNDAPPKGKRTLPKPEYCTINMESNSISTSISEDIVNFEIGDVYGTEVYASFTDGITFVQYLSELEGEYQIIIRTQNHSYIGYISL